MRSRSNDKARFCGSVGAMGGAVLAGAERVDENPHIIGSNPSIGAFRSRSNPTHLASGQCV